MTILEHINKNSTQKIINEIGQRVKPYFDKSSVKFNDNPSYDYIFKDDEGNKINCIFHDYTNNDNAFETEFSINGNSLQALKTSTAHYFKILSSVIEVINAFIDFKDPHTLKINGIDKNPDKEGQKNNIYMAYAKAMIDKTDCYFVSILVDNHKSLPNKKSIRDETSVGIDMGIKTFATLSDGTSYENMKYLRNSLNRLKIEQRTLSRRFKKGIIEQSKRYYKQKLVVAKLHKHIRNQREDYLHKISTSIVKKYDTIILEDLNINGMMKNHNLALSIGDVGWNRFETFLKYKCEWYGNNLIHIGRFEPSSKICSTCGAINKELKLSEREWDCNKCSTHHDRDQNAATNIKTFGLRNKPSNAKTSH